MWVEVPMKSANVAAEITWNLTLAAVAVGVALAAPGIFPPAMGLFALPFVGFAAQAAGRRRREASRLRVQPRRR